MTLNPQYPTSWWGVGFSDEIRCGEVLPVKLLEREVILWRDADGTMHCNSAICPHLGANLGYGGSVSGNTVACPFHGFRFDGAGELCARQGHTARAASERVRLAAYQCVEHFGTIFVWNGAGDPDHAFPVEAFLPEGVESEADTSYFHAAFLFPFPAKLFMENVADANHFSSLHHACDWGDVELLEETPWMLRQKLDMVNPVRLGSRAYLKDVWAQGQLANPPITTEHGMTLTTWGGGLHRVEVEAFRANESKRGAFDKVIDFAGAVRAVAGWTPLEADTHLHFGTFVMPKIKGVPDWVLRRAMNRLSAFHMFGAAVQDCAVMINRQEPAKPAYERLDAGLVRFRRFWDSRLEDRSLWEGDGLHSNGLRAGIRWPDAPAGDELRIRQVTQ